MDVNGTKFHLLLGRADWGTHCFNEAGTTRLEHIFDASEAGGSADFSWDERRDELTLGARVFHFTPSPGNRSVDISGRRGAGVDAFGNVYWIDESGTGINVYSVGSRVTTPFWSCAITAHKTHSTASFKPIDEQPQHAISLAGLAVTTLHYLVVGTIEPAGLLVFDLHRGGEPRQLVWPVEFAPFDLVATKDGGLWVLDAQHNRAWRLDRTMGVIEVGGDALPAPEAPFQPIEPIDPNEKRCKLPSSSITLAMARSFVATNPVAIEVLDDDSILILDSPELERYSRIVRIARDGTVAEDTTQKAESLVEESKRADFQLRGHDFVVVGERLYVAGSDGDQAVAFRIDLEFGFQLHALAEFFPMRLFGARALIAGAESPMYDSQDRWVPLIEQRRQRFAHEARLLIPEMDGKQPDCVWHRLMLDACIPPECEVIIESRATNDRNQFALATWHTEQPLLRRVTGSELAWSNDTREAGIDTWELLFQRATGRYLQLRVTLQGTGRNSPRIRALRAWYPRFSYLDHYLPDCYRENTDSAWFLDRFLANIEGFFTNIEDRIAAAQCLLDTHCAPADTLDWLASWFEVALDPAWSEEKRRLFLRHAADFFEWRGTVPGMLMALRLVSEECADESIFDVEQIRRGPRVVERFRTRSLPGVLFGDTSAVTESGLPLRMIQDTKWQPATGAADLHRRWAIFINQSAARYPISEPASPALRTQWIEFSRATLGFVPRATERDTQTWQDVLRRRYNSLTALTTAWATPYSSWSEIRLFTELPARVEQLRDWVHFEGLVLPAATSAHRFTVFLPQGTLGIRNRERLLELARRVIALEKPAHTVFDVKFYWAFFRIGEARLGEDTVVDLGSRSPELLSPFVLDRNYLGSGWLGPDGCRPCDQGGSR